MDSIRCFDFIFALIGLLILLPIFIVLATLIKLTSKGPVFYKQIRVGKNNKDFGLYKFRSMRINADKQGLLTVGGKDNRITTVGYYLRKFKLDELPQFINVLKGEMSFVGPRPEVRRYVDLYTTQQMQVLNVLPGITDYASIAYRNENELLSKAANPEQYYIDVIMPDKIRLNNKFIEQRSLKNYFSVLFTTFWSAAKGK